MAAPRSTRKHYVDNNKFYTVMLQYRRAYDDHIEKRTNQPPPIPSYIGECLLQIATKLSRKPNFVNYTFREEMVSDGLENCINYLHNFDPEKSKNPFAYFTQIIYFAFLRRIEKEKKHLYIKQKTLENFYLEGMLYESQGSDGEHNVSVDLNNAFMNDLVASFDSKQEEKKRKQKEKKIGLEKFVEEDLIESPDTEDF